MHEIITFIENNIFNLVSLLIGLIGIALAIIFYYKSKKTKLPVYTLNSFNLFNSEFKKNENIEVKYLGKTIKNLTATKFIFWNASKGTIDKNDIPDQSKLTIKTKESFVFYGSEIMYATDDVNQIRLVKNESENKLSIEFDYLDYRQGAIVKLLHSGDSSNDLEISGKVKGVGNYKISEYDPGEEPISTLFGLSMFTLILFIGGLFAKKIFWKVFLFSFAVLFLFGLFKSLKSVSIPKELRNRINE